MSSLFRFLLPLPTVYFPLSLFLSHLSSPYLQILDSTHANTPSPPAAHGLATIITTIQLLHTTVAISVSSPSLRHHCRRPLSHRHHLLPFSHRTPLLRSPSSPHLSVTTAPFYPTHINFSSLRSPLLTEKASSVPPRFAEVTALFSRSVVAPSRSVAIVVDPASFFN